VLAFPDWPDDAVGSIDAPTLVVAADADVVLPGHAAEMARLLPRGRLAILPLTDHGGLLFARAGWLQPMVEAFLDGDARRGHHAAPESLVHAPSWVSGAHRQPGARRPVDERHRSP